MKKTSTLLAALLGLGILCESVRAEGIPKIQFDQTLCDFGTTSQVTTVSGIFKFKNTGDGILKMEKPKPSCGCTAAEVKPDTLAARNHRRDSLHLEPWFLPGEHGETHLRAVQ